MKAEHTLMSFNLTRFAVGVTLSYVVLSAACFVFPTAYSRALAPALSAGAGVVSRHYAIERIEIDDKSIQIKATNSQLACFTRDGLSGPVFTFDATLDARLVNIYPVIVLALLIAWPAFPLRSRLSASLVAALLLMIVGCLDLYILSLWQNATATASMLLRMEIPATPSNAAVYEAIKQHTEHLRLAKSFLSTGGRQFMAVVVFLLSIAPFHL